MNIETAVNLALAANTFISGGENSLPPAHSGRAIENPSNHRLIGSMPSQSIDFSVNALLINSSPAGGVSESVAESGCETLPPGQPVDVEYVLKVVEPGGKPVKDGTKVYVVANERIVISKDQVQPDERLLGRVNTAEEAYYVAKDKEFNVWEQHPGADQEKHTLWTASNALKPWCGDNIRSAKTKFRVVIGIDQEGNEVLDSNPLEGNYGPKTVCRETYYPWVETDNEQVVELKKKAEATVEPTVSPAVSPTSTETTQIQTTPPQVATPTPNPDGYLKYVRSTSGRIFQRN